MAALIVDLLKATDIDGDPAKGKMWDQSLIYIATEFGRDKVSSNGSGHHLNNGVVMISPMLNGNKVFGGVDPETGEIDKTKNMKEKDMYGAICHALGHNYSGRANYKSMVRKA